MTEYVDAVISKEVNGCTYAEATKIAEEMKEYCSMDSFRIEDEGNGVYNIVLVAKHVRTWHYPQTYWEPEEYDDDNGLINLAFSDESWIVKFNGERIGA